jgi:integral membrane sensor domain MASE1
MGAEGTEKRERGRVQGAMAIGVIYLVFSILQLLFSIAFLSLKTWAWWGMLILLAVSIVFAVIGMAVNGFASSSLIGIIIDALLIVYLYRKDVKAAFFGAGASA